MVKSTGAQKEELKKKLKIQREKDSEMVRGIFRFHEVPGGKLAFPYRAYKGDHVEKYSLVDGQEYTIPFGVANHLNKRCWYPEHAYQLDAEGNPKVRVGKKIQRLSFQSLEFTEEALTPASEDLLTVEYVGKKPMMHM